jgi:hypothetical protein
MISPLSAPGGAVVCAMPLRQALGSPLLSLKCVDSFQARAICFAGITGERCHGRVIARAGIVVSAGA